MRVNRYHVAFDKFQREAGEGEEAYFRRLVNTYGWSISSLKNIRKAYADFTDGSRVRQPAQPKKKKPQRGKHFQLFEDNPRGEDESDYEYVTRIFDTSAWDSDKWRGVNFALGSYKRTRESNATIERLKAEVAALKARVRELESGDATTGMKPVVETKTTNVRPARKVGERKPYSPRKTYTQKRKAPPTKAAIRDQITTVEELEAALAAKGDEPEVRDKVFNNSYNDGVLIVNDLSGVRPVGGHPSESCSVEVQKAIWDLLDGREVNAKEMSHKEQTELVEGLYEKLDSPMWDRAVVIEEIAAAVGLQFLQVYRRLSSTQHLDLHKDFSGWKKDFPE